MMTRTLRRWWRQQPVFPALLGAAGLFALASLVRYGLIEPQAVGLTCDGAAAPWWCDARLAVIHTFRLQLFGIGALAAGIAAHLWPRQERALALAALFLGAGALVLYNVGLGVAGFLLGLLALARAGVVAGAAEGG